jgi:four helix bundle protein
VKAGIAMSIKSYRDLDAWKVAMEVAVSVYKLIERLPACERFEMCSQMRKAAVSVPSNVAEGQANGPGLRYRNHVRIASGSAAELSTCVELCVRVGYVDEATAAAIQNELARTAQLLHGLRNSIVLKITGEGAKIGAIVLTCWWLFR